MCPVSAETLGEAITRSAHFIALERTSHPVRGTFGDDPRRTIMAVSRRQVERRLTEVGRRIRELREELLVADEQLVHLADAADDARLRSLVSETPVSDREHREAARHADAMRAHRASVAGEIDRLEQAQDDLLDRLSAETR
jgi:hypothetical protein